MNVNPPAMEVSYFDGHVTIAVPPALARDLAAVWATAHAGDPILTVTRPDWHLDVVSLIGAAAAAEFFAGGVPDPVLVPVLSLPARQERPA